MLCVVRCHQHSMRKGPRPILSGHLRLGILLATLWSGVVGDGVAREPCSCGGGYRIIDADCLDNILCNSCQPCAVPCCTASSHWAKLASSSPWAARDGHAVISAPLPGDMVGASTSVFVLGGRLRAEHGNKSLLNDVWETYEGRKWVQHTFDAIWSPRAFFGAVAVGSSRIFVMGGVADAPPTDEGTGSGPAGEDGGKIALNDVWLWQRGTLDGTHLHKSSTQSSSSSSSGTWVQLTAAAEWDARARFGFGYIPTFPPTVSNYSTVGSGGFKLYVLGGERPQRAGSGKVVSTGRSSIRGRYGRTS